MSIWPSFGTLPTGPHAAREVPQPQGIAMTSAGQVQSPLTSATASPVQPLMQSAPMPFGLPLEPKA